MLLHAFNEAMGAGADVYDYDQWAIYHPLGFVEESPADLLGLLSDMSTSSWAITAVKLSLLTFPVLVLPVLVRPARWLSINLMCTRPAC
jgi:hypothetical protein